MAQEPAAQIAAAVLATALAGMALAAIVRAADPEGERRRQALEAARESLQRASRAGSDAWRGLAVSRGDTDQGALASSTGLGDPEGGPDDGNRSVLRWAAASVGLVTRDLKQTTSTDTAAGSDATGDGDDPAVARAASPADALREARDMDGKVFELK